MTDNEIIKALEFCTCRTKIVCQECPYNINYTECMGLTMKQDALNLINRQNAEIERLQSVNADVQESLRLAAEANKDMQAEVDRYKKYYETMEIEIYSFRKDQAEVKFLKNKIRAEAIKEFAERLKEAFSDLEFEYDPKLRIVKVEEVKSLVDWALHKISIETIQDAAKDISGN